MQTTGFCIKVANFKPPCKKSTFGFLIQLASKLFHSISIYWTNQFIGQAKKGAYEKKKKKKKKKKN